MANWYVRKGGLDTNGGSSNSLTPEKSGTDGTVVGTSATFTSASGQFVAGDVNKGINIAGTVYRIAGYTSATSITLDRTRVAGTSLAWSIGGATLTIGKLSGLTVTTAVQAGDTIWIGAGLYRGGTLTLGASYSGSKVNLVGDLDGVMTGDAGEIVFTSYVTNDKTAPSVSSIIGHASKNFWSIRNIIFITGSGNPAIMSLGNSNNFDYTNCTFLSGMTNNVASITWTVTVAGPVNGTFDRCRFCLLTSSPFDITLPTVAGADYDANIVFKNCIIDTSNVAISVTASGALANKGGGVYIYNCTIKSGGQPNIRTNSANLSTIYPMKIENCLILSTPGVTSVTANTAGQITEAYNLYSSSSTRTNVTVGPGVISNGSYSAAVSFGHEAAYGMTTRPYLSPHAYSGITGFGASASVIPTDILGVTRPAGGSSALNSVGAYERGNTWIRETTTVRTGSTALSITGPGYQDFMVPVDATSTTVSVYLRWDGTYTGTKPSLQIVNSTECGVANATATATGSSGVWEKVSLTFTPTKKGIISVRLLSSDTNGAGKVYADDFEVV